MHLSQMRLSIGEARQMEHTLKQSLVSAKDHPWLPVPGPYSGVLRSNEFSRTAIPPYAGGNILMS